jgi:hypothetical protein
MALFFTAANADQKDYRLNITKDDVVIHNQKDWHYVASSSILDLYLEKGMIDTKQEIVEYHSFIEYKNPQNFDFSEPIKSIYSYGSVHCGRRQLMLLADLFTNAEGKVVRRDLHPKTNIYDLGSNPLLIEIYFSVCKESV